MLRLWCEHCARWHLMFALLVGVAPRCVLLGVRWLVRPRVMVP